MTATDAAVTGTDADTRTRLVDATADIVDEGGEAAVRLRDVAASVGISQPSIYHFFANRDRLIEAAQGVRWRRSQEPMAEFFRDMFGAATTADEFFDAVRVTLERMYRPDRWESRRQRYNVLGSAMSRPDLQATLARSQRQVEVTVAEGFRAAQAEGWMRADVDVPMLVAWIVGQVMGRVFVEIAPDHFDLDAWDAISTGAVCAVIGRPAGRALGDMPVAATAALTLPPIGRFTAPADEGAGTGRRAVDASIAIIESGGESSLRMRDVADRIGVREPSLYHFFENRDDLVVAAQAERWRRDQVTLLRMLEDGRGLAGSRDEFLTAALALLQLVLADGRSVVRRNRAAILGSAQSRPALMASIVEQELERNAAFAATIARAQSRGWVRDDFDPTAFAAWFFGVVNGRLLVEMDPTGVDLASWDAIAREAVFSVLGYPPPV